METCIVNLVDIHVDRPLRHHLLYNAATKKDFPLLEATVLVIGAFYVLATLVADTTFSLLNPRIRYRGVE